MATLLRKVIEILDDTPAEYGKNSRGQSVVELALITPLLIIIFASMVEIGWFANNYLTMLDATRSGARIATGLQDTRSPLEWNNGGSLVPDSLMTGDDSIFANGDTTTETSRENVRLCPPVEGYDGFYNEVACRTIGALEPLPLRNTDTADHKSPDDVVVSAFAVQVMSGSFLNTDGATHPLSTSKGYPADATQAVVVGRYPSNANECEDVPSGFTVERDPFDLNINNLRDTQGAVGVDETYNRFITELPGFDRPDSSHPERERGFSWFGNHRITFDNGSGSQVSNCIGSQWSIADVEHLVNLSALNAGSTGFLDAEGDSAVREANRKLLPNVGVAIVELYWEHKPLLNLPFFEPVFRVFADRATIRVWAAFPLPSVEPYIICSAADPTDPTNASKDTTYTHGCQP